MFVRFKSSENQTGFNRRKLGNRFGGLTWSRDRSIPKTRPIDQSGNRLIEMESSFCDQLTWAGSMSICSAYFCCSRYIYQDQPVQTERLLTGSIDPFEKKKLPTLVFFGLLVFFLINPVENYILIFNNYFVN